MERTTPFRTRTLDALATFGFLVHNVEMARQVMSHSESEIDPNWQANPSFCMCLDFPRHSRRLICDFRHGR
jgi:hypothetical protein